MADGGYQRIPQPGPLPADAHHWVPAWLRGSRTPQRRWLLAVSVGALIVLLFTVSGSLRSHPELVVPEELTVVPAPPSRPESAPWLDLSSSLNFDHPTTLARENLRNDTYYITSFAQAGFTNEFIAYINLVYLGLLTSRVPIIPPIIPAAHVSQTAGTVLFSSVFNLTSLRAALRTPILEWSDVKSLPPNASVLDTLRANDPQVEPIGCWSTKSRNAKFAHAVPPSENLLRLDMSFTRIPSFAYLNRTDPNEGWSTFYGLSAAILPSSHTHPNAHPDKLSLMQKSRLGAERKPDAHLACFDFLYFVTSGTRSFEFEDAWSPVWWMVGRHLRFTEEVGELARAYVRRAFELDESTEIPPMITVHIRHGDFDKMCKPGDTPPCHLPLSAYKEGVEKVQRDVFAKHGVNATHVLVASDETSPSFHSTLQSYGWRTLNHTSSHTVQKYTEWHPIIIDKAALSMGVGFVGTAHSTLSVMNERRVEDWNGGVSVLLDYYSWRPGQFS